MLEVTNVSHRFNRGKTDSTNALESISFRLDSPTVLSILGSNGAGKSTLIKTMLGLICPSEGHVLTLNYNPYKKERAYLKQIGFVSGQKRTLSSDLSASQSIISNALFYDLSLADANLRLGELSELFGVEDKLNQAVRSLSLGETIRFEIINAMIHRPQLLFLDEPSIGLDFEVHEKIINLLHKLHEEEKIGIVLTSHYMRDIKQLSKQILVLEKGKQLYFGSIKELHKIHEISPYLESLSKEIMKY